MLCFISPPSFGHLLSFLLHPLGSHLTLSPLLKATPAPASNLPDLSSVSPCWHQPWRTMGWAGTECYGAEISRQSPLACLGGDATTEAREGEGRPDPLDRTQVTLTLCPVRRHQRKDEAFFFSLLGLDIDAYLGQLQVELLK